MEYSEVLKALETKLGKSEQSKNYEDVYVFENGHTVSVSAFGHYVLCSGVVYTYFDKIECNEYGLIGLYYEGSRVAFL